MLVMRVGLAVVFALVAGAGCTFHDGSYTPDAGGSGPTIDAPPAIDGIPGQPDAPIIVPDADDDVDDDGFANAADNCPTIANPAQHDHDLDTLGDECDRCPHIANAADPDGDLDGVGDACDPRPGTPGDIRVGFYGFYDPSEIAGWGPSTDFTVSGGQLVRTSFAATASIGPTASVHNPYVASHVVVLTVNPSAGNWSAGVSVADLGGTQFYACYRQRGTSSGTPYIIDAFYGLWSTDSEFGSNPAGDLNTGTTLDIVDRIDVNGGDCGINGWRYDGTKYGPVDGPVVAWSDDLTATWDYLFIVSTGD